jgi:hypothetical protein
MADYGYVRGYHETDEAEITVISVEIVLFSETHQPPTCQVLFA